MESAVHLAEVTHHSEEEGPLYHTSFQVGAQVSALIIIRNPCLQLMQQNPNQSQLSCEVG